MDDAVAYADNWSDRSLLEHVGRAVVVHPRGRLLRLAQGAGMGYRPAPPAGTYAADFRQSLGPAPEARFLIQVMSVSRGLIRRASLVRIFRRMGRPDVLVQQITCASRLHYRNLSFAL